LLNLITSQNLHSANPVGELKACVSIKNMLPSIANNGLTGAEAATKLATHGPNRLPENPPPSNIEILLGQLKSPLVYILLAAGIVTAVLAEYSDTLVIGAAVLMNTVLGYVQENRANNALQALKAMIHPVATVIRDGEEIKIDAEEIVPGDIVVLHQGDKVPADGLVVKSNHLNASEAILTGESAPVLKTEGNKVFMGTIVTTGKALVKVEVTGENTEMGKIASSVQEVSTETPLKMQLREFSKQLTKLTVILIVCVFFIGILSGKGIVEIFLTSVALAVSAIPEGLLVALTVVLAIGMQRILKKKGLVRNLISAETLGGVTTICTDKTGTLTLGKLRIVKQVGDKIDIAKQVFITRDSDPIISEAYYWAKRFISKEKRGVLKSVKTVDELPFDAKNRFLGVLSDDKGKRQVYVNGAPEIILQWCDLTKDKQEILEKEIKSLTQEGMRVIGMARKKVPSNYNLIKVKDIVEGGLEWVGILAFDDPVRFGVKEAFAKTKKAGVRLIVVTGDYVDTAQAVLRKLGIKLERGAVITGDDLIKMPLKNLAEFLASNATILFARVKPDEKLKIIEALKQNGEVVAMTGDGVNDAPALARADIGIVVGDATDVAKESSDLVLLNSSFETIVDAVEEGRVIFDNIRKVILNLLCDAFEEIVAVTGTLVLVLPLPVSAVQILWINLISDGLPSLALTVDPKRAEAMTIPPRNPNEKLVNAWMRELIFIISLAGGLLALAVFTISLQRTGDLTFARSMTFAVLGVNSLAYVFSIRALTNPVWSVSPFSNLWVIGSVIIGLIMQVVPFYLPITQKFLEIEPLTLANWFVVGCVTTCMFFLIELLKTIFRIALEREDAW